MWTAVVEAVQGANLVADASWTRIASPTFASTACVFTTRVLSRHPCRRLCRHLFRPRNRPTFRPRNRPACRARRRLLSRLQCQTRRRLFSRLLSRLQRRPWLHSTRLRRRLRAMPAAISLARGPSLRARASIIATRQRLRQEPTLTTRLWSAFASTQRTTGTSIRLATSRARLRQSSQPKLASEGWHARTTERRRKRSSLLQLRQASMVSKQTTLEARPAQMALAASCDRPVQ